MINSSTKNLGPYVFEDIVDGVLLLARDGTIVYANESAQEILQLTGSHFKRSLPGTWLQEMDPRNDNLCQSILDALYEKQAFAGSGCHSVPAGRHHDHRMAVQ